MPYTSRFYHSAETPWDFSYARKAVDSFCPGPCQGLRVLDVGCGNGFWAGRFAEKGCAVIGIDPSQTGVEKARRTYPNIRFEQIPVAEEMCERLGEEPFDLVLSLEVVEHVYAPREWATGCFRALKPGGRLICSAPYHGYLKNLAISLAGSWDRHWGPAREGGHIKFWSRSTLEQLLADAGFDRRTIRFRGAGRLPFLWMSMVICALK